MHYTLLDHDRFQKNRMNAVVTGALADSERQRITNGVRPHLEDQEVTQALTRDSWRQRYLMHLVLPALRMAGPQRVDRLARFLVESRPATNGEREHMIHERIARALGVFDTSRDDRAFRNVTMLRRSNRLHHARFWAELPFVLHAARKNSIRSYLVNDRSLRQKLGAYEPVRNSASGQTAAANAGVLYASACFGNPLVAALALREMHGTLTVIADFEHFPIAQLWRHYWERIDGLWVIDRTRAVKELHTILEAGGAVFLLADQFRQQKAGVAVSWLGRGRTAYRSLGILAARHHARVVPVAADRMEPPMQFQLWIGQADEPSCNPDDTVRAVLGQLEAHVLSALDQYDWAAG